MKKCEIEQILKDTTPEQLAEISDFLVAKLGKSEPPDTAAVVIEKALDQAAQGWEEKDGRFVCKDTCKGRLCMRGDLIADPAVVKKPDPKLDLENLLTPDSLKEVEDPAKGLDALVPEALRDVVQDPAVVKKPDTNTATASDREKLEAEFTPDALKDTGGSGDPWKSMNE